MIYFRVTKPEDSGIRTLWILGLVAVLASTLACQAVLGSPPPTPRPEMEQAIRAFSEAPEDPEVLFETLDAQIRNSPREVEVAALSAMDSPEPEVRLAALYALSLTATTDRATAALKEGLQETDITLRLLAAAGLISRGEPQAIPVLIEALHSNEPLVYSEPPRVAWVYGRMLLIQYVEPEFGLLAADDFESVGLAAEAYQAWWEAQGDGIVWDPELNRFQERAP